MKIPKIFRMSGMALGCLLVGGLAISLTGSPVNWMQSILLESLGVSHSEVQAGPFVERKLGSDSYQIAKGIRPAAKGESPEEAQLRQLPSPALLGQDRRPSKAELFDKCMKSPKCRAKLQAAQKRGSNKPRPATREESPEEKELKTLPTLINPGVLRQKPRSDLLLPEEHPTLLAWLNTFQAAPAYAQEGVSINLTPGGPASSGSFMHLYGATVFSSHIGFELRGSEFYPNGKNSEGKPVAAIQFAVHATGTYLVNVRAYKGKAKLRHQWNGPIIDTWDFTAQPSGFYDYLTAEYLEEGKQNFYFWPDTGSNIFISSASLESY